MQEGNTNGYNFFAEFENIDTIIYEWFIDGDFIELDGGQGADNTLFFEFTPGTYEICIKAETPDCPLGTEFCLPLVVE